MFNPYKRLLALVPNPALEVGVVLSYSDGIATIELPSGGIAQARGAAVVGSRVYLRDGLVEGPAPDLPVEIIEL